jgi:hypothetical protein
MRKLALLALVVPGLAFSQVSMSAGIRFDLPVVLPQLVVVTPGVLVVPEVEHEVFFVNGVYWARDDGRWYRSRSHRRGWVVAPYRVVPVSIREIPPGHYKRWNPGKGHYHQKKSHRHDDRRDHRSDRRADWRDDRRDHDRHDHDRRDQDRRDHDDRGGNDRGGNDRGWKDKGGKH